MNESASIKTRPARRPGNRVAPPADDYDDGQGPVQSAGQDQYEDYDGYDDYYEEDYEEAVVSVNRNRALAVAAAFVMVIGIFAVAVYLLVNSNAQAQRSIPTSNTLTYVPELTGFNAATASENQVATKGSHAPDFTWNDEKGNPVALSSFRGQRPVFVNFWGTWCPPCKIEMPDMRALYNTPGTDIEIIGVSMGPRDWPEQVISFINKTNYNWTFVHDTNYAIAQRYQVNSIPSSYFIDEQGVIQAVHVGAMTRAMMDNYVSLSH